MLAQLSSPPTYVSQEEHDALTSSTPESFTDIPPILRFLDEEVEVVLSPATGWWEGKVKGKLWVTEDAVAFQPVDGVTGFSLPFPSLTLHALTPASPDTPGHIYCQVDESGSGQNEGPSFPIHHSGINGMNGDADENDDDEEGMQGDDDYTPMREIRIFLPEAKLQSLFSALSQCSALHDSLLPNGEPSSFFGFGDMAEGPDDEDDDEGWEDDMDQTEGDSGVDGGRVNKEKAEAKSGTAELESDDPVERFLNMVDWGHVQKPAGWDGGDNGEFDDAEEEGEGEGIPEDLLQRVQQLQMQ